MDEPTVTLPVRQYNALVDEVGRHRDEARAEYDRGRADALEEAAKVCDDKDDAADAAAAIRALASTPAAPEVEER